MNPVDDVKVVGAEAWAVRVAGSLPPLTAAEAVVVGRLAAELDARRLAASRAARARRAAS